MDFHRTGPRCCFASSWPVALYYANFVSHRVPLASKAIVQMDVPKSLIARLAPYTLSVNTDAGFSEWANLSYHCRRGDYLPRSLSHLSSKDLMIGPIATFPDSVYGKMRSSAEIKNNNVLRVGGVEASQHIFSADESVSKALEKECRSHTFVHYELPEECLTINDAKDQI